MELPPFACPYKSRKRLHEVIVRLLQRQRVWYSLNLPEFLVSALSASDVVRNVSTAV